MTKRVLTKRLFVSLVGLIAFLGLASCGDDDEADSGVDQSAVGQSAVAQMSGPDGSPMGSVTLEQGPLGLLVSAELRGLSPGAHGFHIHTVGTCEPDFSAAGGHFAPDGKEHGLMNAAGAHAGDLPNIHATADGDARADFFTSRMTLADGAATSVFDSDGSAVIVHAKPDSYAAEAGAGDRVACGVITRS